MLNSTPFYTGHNDLDNLEIMNSVEVVQQLKLVSYLCHYLTV